jgi:hypothetical protein
MDLGSWREDIREIGRFIPHAVELIQAEVSAQGRESFPSLLFLHGVDVYVAEWPREGSVAAARRNGRR